MRGLLIAVDFGEDPVSCQSKGERVRMVETFCATWKLVDSQNFDEYMKALGR